MVTQMTIPEKLNALEACIAKCEDLSYAVNAKLGNDKEQELRQMRILVQNGRTLMGQLDNLEYEARQEAFRTWHAKLNAKLALFPEYSLEQEETRSMSR
jgi:hypothetical protein